MSRLSRAALRVGLAVGLATAVVAPAIAQAGPIAPIVPPAPPTIAELLAPFAGGFDLDNNNFNVATHLVLQFPDLVNAATKPGASTVFLPTDYAFRRLIQTLTGRTVVAEADLMKAVQRLGTATLGAIVRYHILQGTRFGYGLAVQANGLQVRTMQGGFIRLAVARTTSTVVTLQDAAPRLADAKIVRADMQASNGVLHVIDRVMMPTAA